MDDNKYDKFIDTDIFDPDDHIKTETPSINNIYNDNKLKFSKLYSILLENKSCFSYENVSNGNLN
jgi:hypothetical protein